jgi:hypothetical protein
MAVLQGDHPEEKRALFWEDTVIDATDTVFDYLWRSEHHPLAYARVRN